MSDTWYRDPLVLPPFEDGFGKLWTFDDLIVSGPQPSPPLGITWADVLAMYARLEPSLRPQPERIQVGDEWFEYTGPGPRRREWYGEWR